MSVSVPLLVALLGKLSNKHAVTAVLAWIALDVLISSLPPSVTEEIPEPVLELIHAVAEPDDDDDDEIDIDINTKQIKEVTHEYANP